MRVQHMEIDPMHRRDFLRAAGASALGLALPLPVGLAFSNGRAKGPRPVLVVVFLRGGCDALNVIVPSSDPRYEEIRPTIAIPRDGSEGRKAIPLDGDFGLHPALAPLLPLYRAGHLAPLLCTGSPHPTRSHFDAQDFMEYAAPGLRTLKQGWLNRYLEATRKAGADRALRAVALQGLLPRALRGPFPVLAVPSRGRDEATAALDFFDELYVDEPKEAAGMKGAEREPEDSVLASGRDTIETLRRFHELQRRAARQPTSVRYPRGTLGDRLKEIAALIKQRAGLEVACADWNGWDHHAGQGGLDGRQASMLEHLGAALAAFFHDLGEDAGRTLVLTMSEFGRTCSENGNAGTDHGHGGFMLALGGAVRGGEIRHGRWRGLAEKELYQGRDLPVHIDFRDVMAEVLERHLRFKLPRDFFPEYRPGRGPGLLRT